MAQMIACAEEFAPPSLVAALRGAEPVGEVSTFRFPGGVWRRYDKMRRFPAGLLAIGDAICSFNPFYGQGMTVAAHQAVALRGCLARADGDLSRQFFRAAAKQIRPIWWTNQINDFSIPPAGGRRSILRDILNGRMDRALSAATNDTVVTERLLRVTHLVDSPKRLLHPALMMRIINANRARA